ncbi:MAG: 2-hydroxychromene-2-carboxylate isomerase [Gammaproteobacteria bacterium]|nr:2-hydroxychromene-2-carboxylate isomerase [Gammaproteobacteria bacterium]
MTHPIDFYFDYSSPYGYLASTQIEALAKKHNREVRWHPILLGAIFKVTETKPLVSYPLKGEYAEMDFNRSAREKKIPYQKPSSFPIGTVALCRATYWALDNEEETISSKATDLIKAGFKSYYQDDKDISNTEVVAQIVETVGLDAKACLEACSTPQIKDRLRTAIEAAIERGVFGSPMMYIDDEPFWGGDRLEQMDRWMTQGGW